MLFLKRLGNAVIVIHRNGFTPVALPTKDGVAQTVIGFAETQFLCFYFLNRADNRVFYLQSVEKLGVDYFSFLAVERFRLDVPVARSFHHLTDGKAEVLRKGVVPTVVGRNGHDGARAVAGQYVIGDIDRNGLTAQGVCGVSTRKLSTHGFGFHHAVAFRFARRLFTVGVYLFAVVFGGEFLHPFVLGSQHHKRHPVKRIRTCGKHLDCFIAVFYWEEYRRAL